MKNVGEKEKTRAADLLQWPALQDANRAEKRPTGGELSVGAFCKRLSGPIYCFSGVAVPGAGIPSLFNSVIISSGSGKTMVVFFSTPISARVCK